MQLSTRDEQLDVLAKVLSAGEDEAGIEVAPVGDDVMRTKAALAQRTTGNLAALSGAHGLTYMEVQAQTCTLSMHSLHHLVRQPAVLVRGLASLQWLLAPDAAGCLPGKPCGLRLCCHTDVVCTLKCFHLALPSSIRTCGVPNGELLPCLCLR